MHAAAQAAPAPAFAVKAFHAPAQAAHRPKFFLQRGQLRLNLERPERADALLADCQTMADVRLAAPATPDAIHSVHAPDYIAFLAMAHTAWAQLPDAGPEVVANLHLIPEMLECSARPPLGIVGQAAWFMADAACPIGPATFDAACASAGCALAAAEAARTDGVAYALCRPPGHHAYAARAGGHCYLNNAAIAAEALARGGVRVAVLDIDSHHGNGTQGIFYERADILVASVHADPNQYYPWLVGHATERGAGAGIGANLNLPLPLGTGDADWLAAIGQALEAVRAHGAEALVVSLGFDASIDEPLAALSVSDAGFAAAAKLIRAGFTGPTVLVQEGGYNTATLGNLLARTLRAWD